MFCNNCGKEISDNAYVCPNCGVKVAREEEKPNNNMAIVGFVLSILVNLAGLIVSILALKKSKEMDGTGKSLAIAGIIIASISIVLSIIMFAVYMPMYFALLDGLTSYYAYIMI